MSFIKQIRVVAGVLFNEHKQVLLSTRPKGKSYEGYWEFAGGKIEEGESHFDALKRELDEELNIHVLSAKNWLTKVHRYDSAHIHLNFFKVTDFTGEVKGNEGQDFCWQDPTALTVSPVLVANTSIMKALGFPKIFHGSLQTRLTGEAYQHQYVLEVENPVDAKENGLILSAEKIAYILDEKESLNYSNDWIVAHIVRLEDWDKCHQLGVDAVIFSVLDEDDIRYLLSKLQKGMPTQLIIDNPNQLNIEDALANYDYSIILP